MNCDKCVYWLLPLCWVENVWWWHICLTETHSELCSHTCISHSITDNISNVSPLSSKGILYNNQLEIGKYESLPAKSLWSWWVVPDLPGPDWHPQIKRRIEIRIAVNAAQTWCANLRWREREGGCQYCQVWGLMTGLPRIFDKVNIKTFPSNVKSLFVVTFEMWKCCYSLHFKHRTEVNHF